uniref:Uncharacterized protein n=1 Tax=Anguilla anguilla TaxID=7936 RepID=A0A0E9UMQ0_ANGAN
MYIQGFCMTALHLHYILFRLASFILKATYNK